MNLPAHPQHHDDLPATTSGRRRAVTIAVVILIALAGLHVVRAALA
jgi:hypothetical protein